MVWIRALAAVGVVAGAFALSMAARAQAGESVRVTTDPSRVAGCTPLGTRSVADPSGLDLLRADAARRGANVIRLTALSERGIAAELYRCGAEASQAETPTPPPLPIATRHPGATAAPVAAVTTPGPLPTSVPTSARRTSRLTPTPLSTAERQRVARQELDSLKASVVVVSDPDKVEGCDKRGEMRAGMTEDSLREDAVGALANVVLVRRAEAGSMSGELYRCPRAQYLRLLAVSPAPSP